MTQYMAEAGFTARGASRRSHRRCVGWRRSDGHGARGAGRVRGGGGATEESFMREASGVHDEERVGVGGQLLQWWPFKCDLACFLELRKGARRQVVGGEAFALLTYLRSRAVNRGR
eukprot:250605-Pleurochrysis_carterae.AAC.1